MSQAHIRIYTDQGLIGQGESTDAAIATPALVRSLRGFLVGKDALEIDALWEEMRRGGIFHGAQGGQFVAALSGLEIALWDLAGKALGLPVYQLLGGEFRDPVRIYSDTDMRDNMGPECDRKVAFAAENGFSVAKIDVDDGQDPNRFDRFDRTANNAEMDRVQVVKELVDRADETHIHDEWTKMKFGQGGYKSTDIYGSPHDPALIKEYKEYLKKRLEELHKQRGEQ